MFEIVIAVVLEVAKCLVPPLGRRIDYFRNFESNFEKLDHEAGKLRNARDEVKRKVDVASKNEDKIRPEVKTWQDEVESILKQTDELNGKKEADNGCFKWLTKRHKHSKEASRKVEDIARLLKERVNDVSEPTIPEQIWLRSPNKDYQAFESRNGILKETLTALNDANVHMVGVHGMGGIGKTTLAKEIGRQAKKLFDRVVFVEISQNPDIKKIQQEIAGEFGLPLNDQIDGASKLFARLRNENNILIILDNVWEDLDFEKVGIPFGDDNKGRKLLLTSRDRHLLERMGASRRFPIDILGEDEARNMFRKMAGDIENEELKPLATQVVKQCGGLPIAIATVAKVLKGKRHKSQWREALKQLSGPSPTNFEGVYGKAYSCIKLSYDYLRDELQKTFLLCSLIKSDASQASISDLLKYAMGLDMFQATYTVEETRDKAYSLIDELKDLSLLLDGRNDEWFSLHDFVRDVAVSIAKGGEHLFYVRNETNWELPRSDTEKSCTKFFLHDIDTWEPPVGGLECPQLESLCIIKKYDLRRHDPPIKIPETFFTEMVKLKVLDLNRIQLFSLKSSLHPLVNLQTLCLDYCQFEDVAFIGEMKKLKILRLRRSNIKLLPSEIGQLGQLRLLDLSDCRDLNVIASNVISSLSRLEEVYMRGCCRVQWEVKGVNVESGHACLEELCHSSRLTTLEIDIEDDKVLPTDFFSKKLERYAISIGQRMDYLLRWDWDFMQRVEGTSRRMLKLKLKSSICLKEKQNIKNAEALVLDEWQGEKDDLLCELGRDGFLQLKHLGLKNNHQFRCIVDSMNLVARDAFPALESLFLSNLSNLEKICRGQFTTESFSQLRWLTLRDLPQLRSFDSKASENNQEELTSSEGLSNEIVLETGSDIPTSLFNGKVVFPKLEALELNKVNVEKIWDGQQWIMSSSYKNLTRLIVDNCQKLKYLFSYSMVKSLEQLQHLEISNCIVLKEIVEDRGGAETATCEFIFPQVTFIKFWHLPELTTFYPRTHTSKWPILKKLEIGYCGKVNVLCFQYNAESQFHISGPQSLFMAKEAVFPKLEVLELKNMNVEKIWDNQLLTMASPCQNMTRLIVDNCQKLKYLFSYSTVKSFEQLRHLEISNCSVLKEIVEDRGGAETATCEFVFPQVTYIKLWELPELTTFYPRTHTSKWPILKKLEIGYCGKVNVLCFQYNAESQFHISRPHSLFVAKEVVFPKLEVLELRYMNVEEIWHSQHLTVASIQCPNLTRLIVDNCQKLKYLFSYPVAKSPKQLQHLEISNCSVLKEIVGDRGSEEPATCDCGFVFPRVNFLKLWHLPELTALYPRTNTSKWPTLKHLEIGYCDKVNVFISEYSKQSHCDILTPQSLFLAQKINPNLEELTLGGKNITMMWQAQFQEHHFSKLKVTVEDDESTNIPLPIPKNLEKLRLCNSWNEEIFSCGKYENCDGTPIQLKVLEMKRLYALKNIWKQDNLESLLQNLEILKVEYCDKLMNVVPSSASFQNLTILEVSFCDGLLNLITSSTAKSLKQLREMKIAYCQLLIEIVSKEDDLVKDEIVFNKLKFLSLKDIGSLISFCSGNQNFIFPSLEKLIINRCPMMKNFSGGVITAPMLQEVTLSEGDMEGQWDGDLQSTIENLHKAEVNTNSKKLILSGDDIRMTWQGQFPEHYSTGVKVLEVIKDESANIPLGILERFSNLEELILKRSSYKEIFSSEGGQKHGETVPHMKRLDLRGLFDLKQMWQQDSQVNSVLQNLESLNVDYCNSLINLAPNSASFENLTSLSIWNCDGLRNLVTSSTAKSLVRLESLYIGNCEMMIEIVENSEDEARDDEINFNNLKELSLTGLESLSSFCSGNCSFNFPALEKITILNCPNMKALFEGLSSAAKLWYVQMSRGFG